MGHPDISPRFSPGLSGDGFKKLFDRNPMPMWVFDADTLAFIEVNDAAILHYGYSREEFLGMTLFDVRPCEEIERFQSFREQLIGEPEMVYYKGEWIHRKKNGTNIHVEVSSLRFLMGKRQTILSVMNDITERKRAERLLRESEHRFRMLSEAAVEAILIHQDLQIREVNTSLLKLFGFSHEQELIGRSPLEFVAKEYKAFCLGKILEGSSEPYELVVVCAGGRELTVEVHARAIRYREGTGRVVVLHDITERKRHERELVEREARLESSNRELEQFAYVTSHDLQEPLRMVASYVGLIEKACGSQLDPDARQYIHFAIEGSKRMKRLIDDLLQLSMVGKRELSFRPVGLSEVLRGVLFDLRLLIEETQADIQVDPTPQVMGDPSQLRQLFHNLITNAIKFRGDGPPRIKISAVRRLGDWLIQVKDRGIGIEMQYADRIFRIFQRLHTMDEYPGTGIGLAICKKIIERHGGKIWVESQPGEGCIFSLTLRAVDTTRIA